MPTVVETPKFRQAILDDDHGVRDTVIHPRPMPAKKNKIDPDTLSGAALVKEVNRRIRLARSR